MVSALHQVVSDRSVSTFDASFRWAPGLQERHKLPAKVEIAKASSTVLKRTFELMKPTEKSKSEFFTGQIIQLRDEDSLLFGDVSIRTVRNGRTCEITVRLRDHPLKQAYRWFEEREVIIVEGEVESAGSRGLHIERPSRVQPLSETLLFEPDE